MDSGDATFHEPSVVRNVGVVGSNPIISTT